MKSRTKKNISNIWIIILTYTYPEGLDRLLTSLGKAGEDFSFIRVVFNGVDKEKYKFLLDRWEDKLQHKTFYDDNIGYFKAYNNEILKVSSEDYLFLLNDDIVINTKDWKDIFFENMNELVGLVGIQQEWRDQLGNEQVDEFRLFSCCIMNPIAVRKTGLFDEKYICYFGDIEYLLRMHSQNYTILPIRTDAVWHERCQTLKGVDSNQKNWSTELVNDAWCFCNQVDVVNYEWRKNFTVFDVNLLLKKVKRFVHHMMISKGNKHVI